MTEIKKDIKTLLEELTVNGLIELKVHKGNYVIPYIMNDAAECYICLENCELKGNMIEKFDGETNIRFISTPKGRDGIIFYQGAENVVSLWYEKAEVVCNLYSYHKLGHFWREGQEQWRRLVYVIGTIYDKYLYLGAFSCNADEQQLMQLLGFEPFRYWSPVEDDFMKFYDIDEVRKLKGIEMAAEISKDAGDNCMYRFIWLYKNSHIKVSRKLLSRFIQKRMSSSKGIKFYKEILDRLEKAVKEYPERIYENNQNSKNDLERKKVTQALYKKGFEGSYPVFTKDNIQVTAIEEIPYVVKELEYENIEFKIRFMVSVCRHDRQLPQEGFFCNKGNYGYIADETDII